MASAWTLIASNTLTSSAASITFSGINTSAYVNLLIIASCRSDVGSAYSSVSSSTNNTGVNYGYQFFRAYGNGSPTGSGNTNVADYWYGIIYNSASTASPSTAFGNYYLEYPGYANYGTTGHNKTMYFYGAGNAGTGSVFWVAGGCGTQNTTSATTSITLSEANSGNFVANSTFYLYGKS